ncbi:MAG: hypothetical protein COB67_00880 [SAR324 cluster bacterium]|uniref:Probable chemoreceptor glutamine deamidase CheD n=1 Tax=SAR324 cluster bacterium TaxID=2024889 RepID=A0A2A4TAT6_9DELT|nr:MAG: hypothetical protein COB67_00880 [SAR324 cluster bacterium]
MANPYHLTTAKRNYHVQPGEVFLSKEDMRITTLLGSCVAVCIWDSHRKMAGMNHIMLPITMEEEFASTKYGNVATFVLYDMIRKEGSLPRFLEAQVFGGASRLALVDAGPAMNVGARNIEITLKVLEKLKVKVVRKEVGGHRGRKIYFDVQTGLVKASFIKRFNFLDERNRSLNNNRR